jgi:hypothetical protein
MEDVAGLPTFFREKVGRRVIGYWLLVIGYWLLVIGYWLLVIGYWLLVMGRGSGVEKAGGTAKTPRSPSF